MERMTSQWRPKGLPKHGLIAAAILLILIIAAFGQVWDHGFVIIDDPSYITQNAHVRGGLSRENLSWAFTTFHMGNWHPLTWISHMIDVELFGMDPGGAHLVNLALHLMNTLLLFALFREATGEDWTSGFLAAIFAIHPLHVESVAWVSERKDVLSAFLILLTLWNHVRYARKPGTARYLLTLLLFTLSLMAKPMGVTVPFVLLLMDYWPLGRFTTRGTGGTGKSAVPWRKLLLEKAPLLALALASGAVTLIAQRSGEAVSSVLELPLAARLSNAVLSYVHYLWKGFYPASLSVFYPHPWELWGETGPTWQLALAVLFLAGSSAAVLWQRRRAPFLVTGWFWFLGMLLPVIGLVQVGRQAMADRYTYLPLVGLSIVVVRGLQEAAPSLRLRPRILATAGTLAVLALATMCHIQVSYWKSGVSLFEHALAVTPENPIALNGLGSALMIEGRTSEAIPMFKRVLMLKYTDTTFDALTNLGYAYTEAGRPGLAIEPFRWAMMIKPDSPSLRLGFASALVKLGRRDEAAMQLRETLRLDPGNLDALVLLNALNNGR